MTKLVAALGFLALNFYTYYYLANDAVIPPRRSFAEFPLELPEGWLCRNPEQMDENVTQNLGVTDYLLCTFGNPERKAIANVYVGYHEKQVREEGGGASENSIHPPAHCLPGSGWDIVRNEKVTLDMEGLPGDEPSVRRLLIAKGKLRQLVYYWYQSRGRVIADDWRKVVYVGFDRAVKRRTDGSLVRFTVPVGQGNDAEDKAEATFRSLAPLVTAQLPEYVPN